MRGAVLAGAAIGAAVAFPASLTALVLDALEPGDEVTTPMWVLLVVALAGAGVGGFAAARSDDARRVAPGVLAGVLALVPSSALALGARAAAERDLPWAGVVANALVALLLGTIGALLARVVHA